MQCSGESWKQLPRPGCSCGYRLRRRSRQRPGIFPPARPSLRLLVCLLPVQKTPQSLASAVTVFRANFRSCLANRSFSSCVLHRTMLCGAPRPTPQRQDSIFDLAIQKHKPGCRAASAFARLAGDSSRQHGCPELRHQFIWNAFQDFACLGITVFPSRFDKELLLSHVLLQRRRCHRAAPNLNLLSREPGVQVVGIVSLTLYGQRMVTTRIDWEYG